MPHYYFHVRNQTSYTRDEEGHALADLDAARARASDAAGQILTSELHEGKSDVKLTVQVDVRDETGETKRVLTVHVTGVVEIGAGD